VLGVPPGVALMSRTRLANGGNVTLTRLKPDGTKQTSNIDVQGMIDGRVNPLAAPELQPDAS
jgi:hypothetical protein